jgi:TolB-like protein/DNA-binding winged helix-turn-helix (wHTH) protein/Tfp pilus assembly protein PilF
LGSVESSYRVARFEGFELDLRAGELRRAGGKSVSLAGQPFRILAMLLERPGDLVTRDEIRDALWPHGTIVEFEHSISAAINRLRQVLDDSAEEPRFIETLARRGYRWKVKVEWFEKRRNTAEPAKVEAGPETQTPFDRSLIPLPRRFSAVTVGAFAAVAITISVSVIIAGRAPSRLALWLHPPAIRSIAVLPLQNLSGDPAQEYFAEGMTDELITELAQSGIPKVISRTSVMRFKSTKKSLPEIARELEADAVVEGTVLRSGDRVRITAQLIHGATDRHMWSGSYERDLKDILALQRDVAQAIAGEIKSKLAPWGDQAQLAVSRPVNPEAHEAYLMGRFFWNKRTRDGLMTSLNYFQKAVALDPQDPLGYTGTADSYSILGALEWLAPSEAFPKAREAALKALEFDDTLAEAHSSLGQVYEVEGDWAGTEREFKRALTLNPSLAVAHSRYSSFLLKLGRREGGVAEAKRARDLDPLSPLMNVLLGQALYHAHRFDESQQVLLKTLELDPNFSGAHIVLASTYAAKEMFRESVAELQKAAGVYSGDVMILAPVGYDYAKSGRRSDAEKILKDLQAESQRKYVSGYFVSWVCIGLGKKDEAIQWLERAYQQKDYQLTWMGAEPLLDPLRSDTRFLDLLRRLGLPQ